jgi:hypothetical protein
VNVTMASSAPMVPVICIIVVSDFVHQYF